MNRGYQNLHTHTTYCDGKYSAEEMVKAAIQKGGGSIGFSEHSFVPFNIDYSIAQSDIPLYVSEISSLKEKYSDEIDIFLGMEQDYFTSEATKGLDYVIGALHHVEAENEYVVIDGKLELLLQGVSKHFGGDFLALTEAYFDTIADIAEKTTVDIVGHFDLVAKYNVDGRLFDETAPRYINAATRALERIITNCKLFEVNTGAMYRVGKLQPYPSKALLIELFMRGGEVTISGDSHDADSLYYKFDEVRELLKTCGFKHIKRLTKNGLIDERL